MPKRQTSILATNPPKRGRPGGGGRGKKGGGPVDVSATDDEIRNQIRRREIIEGGKKDKDDDDEEGFELEEEGGKMLEDIYIPPKITRTEHPFTGERMVIEKIVCENFKSYAGIKEMGPFHKSFTAIIGPNGNGKSNIIDALLFVFGYRASKIRCKKVATLIHNSEILPNLKRCAVTVHFARIVDDGDKSKEGMDDYHVVGGSQITVKRVGRSDNSSQYYLNDKTCKFQDVAQFLKSNGVDLTHNRFLILQGEVEQIAQMPPIATTKEGDGLLEFLEDVIGTKRYIRPLALLEERVEKLDYERDEKCQRVDKAEKEKSALVEPVKKVKDYLREVNSKIRYQNILYQKTLYEAKQGIADKEKAKTDLEAKVAAVQQRLDEIQNLSKERKQALQVAEKEFRQTEKEQLKIKKEFDDSDAEFIQLNQELTRTNETRKKLMKEVTKLKEEIEKLQLTPETHKKDIEQLTKRKLELETDIEKEGSSIKGDLARLTVKIEEALKLKEVADRKFAAQKTKRDAKKAISDKLQKQLANSQNQEAREKQKLDDLEADLKKLKETITSKDSEGRKSVGASKIPGMENKHKELLEDDRRLQLEENAKRQVFENMRGELAAAQEAIDGNNQLDRVDRALMEAKADGTLPGLYGRMKNLAKIPEKYNVAATVSTGHLEYWVVDHPDTGTKCIEFLRKEGLGVETFLALSQLGEMKRFMQQPFRAPNGSERIFDLLQIQIPEVKPAFYKAFRNTLVADNIDIATEVSYGRGGRRERVVTLLGEIVEVTGTLVGGGNRTMIGKFNSKNSRVTVTKQQLTVLKNQHEQASQDYRMAQEARQKVTANCRKLSEDIEELRRKAINSESDIAALKQQLPLKQANVESQRKRLKEVALSPQALKEKESEVKKAVDELEALLEDFNEAEEEVTRNQAKLHDLEDVKKKEITRKYDKFSEQLKKVKLELDRKIVELKNCETNRKKSEAKLEKSQKEITTLQETMAKKNERRKEVEARAIQIKATLLDLEEKLKACKEAYEEKKSTAFEFQKEENAETKKKAALENQLKEAEGVLRGCAQQIKSAEENLKALELYQIPEEEVEPLKQFPDEEIKRYQFQEVDRKIKKYAERIKARATPNLNILDEYKEKLDTLMQRITELEQVTTQRDKFREALCLLDQQRSTEFMEGFALISSRLKEMFRMISMGGDAELEVVDTLDLFGCGINFSVRPAKKTWKKISNLSGGEKTLASLSLVFALHHFKPSPFYVMDEIDAALDFKNVSIIANYIKDRTKFTQFIIISLRSNMFELADSLLGVYKVDSMSYCIHFGVKKIVTELKRKYGANSKEKDRYQHALPLKESQATTVSGTKTTTVGSSQGSAQPSSQSQSLHRVNGMSPVPGTSRSLMRELERAKAARAVAFPVDLSAVADSDDSGSENVFQKSDLNKGQDKDSTAVEVTMTEEAQVVAPADSPEDEESDDDDIPCAQGQPPRRSIQSGANEPNDEEVSDSQDMSIHGLPVPIAASTPFVGPRSSLTARQRPPNPKDVIFDSDDSNKDESMSVDDSIISPIRNQVQHKNVVASPDLFSQPMGPPAPIPPPPPPAQDDPNATNSSDSFRTADDTSENGSLDEEVMGPSQ